MKYKWLSLSLAAALAAGFCPAASAAEMDAGFWVSAVIPDNQRDAGAAYFDLETQPGQEQDLVVLVRNPGKEEIAVTVETVTASTNRNGLVHYSGPGLYDETIPFLFSDIAAAEEPRLVLPPDSTTEAVIHLAMPDKPFSGMLLGAVRFVKELAEEDLEVDGVVNQFSYVVGVRLYGEETGEPADFALAEVSAGLVNHKAAIVAEIRSPNPFIADGIQVQATVYEKASGAPVIEKTQPGVEMAPHSIFPMTLIDQEGYGFPPGDYTAQVLLTQENQTWEFRRDFTIQPAQSAAINGGAVNQQQHAPAGRTAHTAAFVVAGLGTAAAALIIWRRVLLRKKGAVGVI